VLKLKRIFQHGDFISYSKIDLNEARGIISEISNYQKKTTVFISHKHDDLEDLKGIIGFLEKNYKIKAYIDSQDPSMPKKTSSQTAEIIKGRIKQCDRFILLATNGAVESKWCNWELGFGDAMKYKDYIALFPMKPEGTYDSQYKGHEYMGIYPYIAFFDGTEIDSNGNLIPKDYYVVFGNEKGSSLSITPLKEWFEPNFNSIF